MKQEDVMRALIRAEALVRKARGDVGFAHARLFFESAREAIRSAQGELDSVLAVLDKELR